MCRLPFPRQGGALTIVPYWNRPIPLPQHDVPSEAGIAGVSDTFLKSVSAAIFSSFLHIPSIKKAVSPFLSGNGPTVLITGLPPKCPAPCGTERRPPSGNRIIVLPAGGRSLSAPAISPRRSPPVCSFRHKPSRDTGSPSREPLRHSRSQHRPFHRGR